MIELDILKCDGQYSKLMHMLAILINFLRYEQSLMITLRYLHNNLLGPGNDKLLYLRIIILNSSLENGIHLAQIHQINLDLLEEIPNKIVMTWIDKWSACQKSLNSRQDQLLYWIASMSGNLYFFWSNSWVPMDLLFLLQFLGSWHQKMHVWFF